MCHTCHGTGQVEQEVGQTKDGDPLYLTIQCPRCRQKWLKLIEDDEKKHKRKCKK